MWAARSVQEATWGQGAPNTLQAAQGGDGGIQVGQLAERLPGLGQHGPRGVDPDQVGQLRVELPALEGSAKLVPNRKSQKVLSFV